MKTFEFLKIKNNLFKVELDEETGEYLVSKNRDVIYKVLDRIDAVARFYQLIGKHNAKLKYQR